MLELFISNLTDEFKEKLLAETRNEIKQVFDYSGFDADIKAKVEMFIVQPLFYAKLNSYAAIWIKENEVSIEDIVTNPTLTDEQKQQILSVIANKANIPFTSIEETSAKLIEKLFLYANESNSVAEEIVSNSSNFSIAIPSSKDLTFVYNGSQYIQSKFYVPFILENLKSDYFLDAVHTHPISQTDIDDYKSLDLSKRIISNAVFVLDKDANTNTKSISVNVADGETTTVNIEGIITDISMPDSLRQRAIISMDNYLGFSNNSISIKIFGPANGSIQYTEIVNSEDILSEASIKELATRVLYPYKLECSISLKSSKFESFFTDLGEYENYDDFLNRLRVAISKIENPYYMPYEYKAKLWLNPFVYLETDFSIFGLINNPSVVIDSIDPRSIIAKLSSIYIKETDELITL